ncbi:MAG TPA: phospholipase D-like domain-containing protein [Usitatibacter sp.]|nr:phospholipase D-like domain-containing protein [Usitatibacter sp.]
MPSSSDDGALTALARRFVHLLRLPFEALLLALALALGGCASVPDLDRYILDTQSVRLEGAKGTLSREQSAKILAQLRQRSPDTGILDRHVAIEEALSGHPLSIGNKAAILEDGKETYAQMLAAIHGARTSVHMEMYIFEDDEVGQAFAAALEERAHAGLQVRLLYDSVGSHKTDKAFFKAMSEQGVHVAEYNPVSPEDFLKKGFALQRRDHRKVLVVDGRLAFIGGINVSGVYGSAGAGSGRKPTSDSAAPGSGSGSSGGSGALASSSGSSKPVAREGRDVPFDQRPWRDLQVRLEGPVVADVQQAFIHQWAKATKETLADPRLMPRLSPQGHEIVRLLESAAGEEPNRLYVALVSAIENAETEVVVMNAYFVPHPDLSEALQAAARRGVNVRLILPSKSDNALVFQAGRSYYEDLLEAGVKIYERQARFLHAKSALVDGVWSTIGSTNLDWRSLVYNDELNAVVLSPDFAQQMRHVFDEDLAASHEITKEAWAHRPVADRLREAAARLWAHLL